MRLGTGFTVCPEAGVAGDLASGRLCRVNWQTGEDQISLIMIWHAEKWCSPLLTRFMEMAEERLSEG